MSCCQSRMATSLLKSKAIQFVFKKNIVNPSGNLRCLKNTVAVFNILEKELEWRKSTGRAEGFSTMKASKPIVAVGATKPLEDDVLMADYFRKYSINLFEISILT